MQRLGHRSGRGGRPLDHDRRGVPGDHRTPLRHHHDRRVAAAGLTVGFNEQDFALAFDVVPVGVREFLGYDAPNRPWAPETVRGKDIPTVGANDLDFEKIASLDPDLILGINSYVDQAAYDKLAVIAPTVAQSGDVADGATTWQDQTLVTGKALGQDAKAKALVDPDHPAVRAGDGGEPDLRRHVGRLCARLVGGRHLQPGHRRLPHRLADRLGFTVPEKSGEVSFEQLESVFGGVDVLVAEGVDATALANPVTQALAPVKEGRFLDMGAFDQDFAAALGFNSPLSLPFVLDAAVPRLAAATDGDAGTSPEPYTG